MGDNDSSLYRNVPPVSPTGGNPAKASNANLMRGLSVDRYAAGMLRDCSNKTASILRRALSTALDATAAGDERLRKLCAYWEAKTAGEEREPEIIKHDSSPTQALRPRGEMILYCSEGVYGLDKGDYILFPGGGIDDGEQPRDGTIRESLEESNRHAINVEGAGVIESIWPEDSGNDFWDESEFDGERTYFFLGLDAGDAGISHDDIEDFDVIGFNQLIGRLRELIAREDQAWARRNNEERLALVRRAARLVRTSYGLKPRKQAAVEDEWIGVDFDGTLARYDGWKGPAHFGKPIKKMVERVRRWLDDGRNVKIFTARVADEDSDKVEKARKAIQVFCRIHLGRELPVTAVKDPRCVELWDDRAHRVARNKGDKLAGYGEQVRYDDYETEYTEEQRGRWTDDVDKRDSGISTDKPETAPGSSRSVDGLTTAHTVPVTHTQVEKSAQQQQPSQQPVSQITGIPIDPNEAFVRDLARSVEVTQRQDQQQQQQPTTPVPPTAPQPTAPAQPIAPPQPLGSAPLNKQARHSRVGYGVYDEDEELDRFVDGGLPRHIATDPDKLRRLMRRFGEHAERQGFELRFSPYKLNYNPDTKEVVEWDTDEAIKRLETVDPGELYAPANPSKPLPYYYRLGYPAEMESAEHPLDLALRDLEEPEEVPETKVADAASLLPRNQYLMVTPAGEVIARRLGDRRFTFPEQGVGDPAPYEDPIRYVPPGGVPEEGYHGYEVRLNVGSGTEAPEGFEPIPAAEVMRDLYASMGLSRNKPFRPLDRARARSLLRYLKRLKRRREEAEAAIAGEK